MNAHFTFKDCKLILGGHSKGGNLALVAAMYSNFLVRNKIIEIYSYDGQGLLEEQLNSSRYNFDMEILLILRITPSVTKYFT